ncbi:MAG: cytochrome c [Bdellovibrionales bacterium]|nr:cytochrome c [Bdellovibrionales bacterium]
MKAFSVAMLAVATFVVSGCGYLKHAEPYYSYAPDMHYSPGLKAQEVGAMRPPPAGAIPRGFRPYSLTSMDQAKGNVNPLSRSHSVLQKGRQLYDVYCIVCHGKYGEGDGLVAAKPDWPRPLFPRPPSLQSDKINEYKDGQIYHVIAMGQNLMPSYAEKLNEEERWSIVHYIRALHRAKHPTAEDLKKAEDYVEEN